MSSLKLRHSVLSPPLAATAGRGGQSAEATPSSPAQPKLARGKPQLLSFDELPEWYQDNEHIRHGYRPVSGSVATSFFSWGYIHNETVNIYSHLIPAVAFLFGEWYILHYLHSRYARVTMTDDIIFAFFLLTAAVCLGFSTTYHTLLNHSSAVETIWLRLDFTGIALLTIGDIASGIYMVFWCEPIQRRIYWAMITTLGSLTVFIMVNPNFQGRRWRKFRILCFVGTGTSGFAPVVHGIYLFGLDKMLKQSGLPYYLLEASFLFLGAFIYGTRFPESIFPGRFNIYGSSHQLFHVLVAIATFTQLVGLLAAFDYNYHHRTCSLL